MAQFSRRRCIEFAAAAAMLPIVSRFARAEVYPSRPVRIIVGFSPGGPNDITARLIGQWLSERLGQPFVIDNRPGASSNLATEDVAHAPADGYTLLSVAPPAAINAALYTDLRFNFIRDIAPVASVVRVPQIMLVNPSVPANSVAEFIAYAKAHPGKVNMAHAGNGSLPHVAGELFKSMTGLDLTSIGYRGGGPALVDLMAGQVQVMFETTLAALPYVKVGKLRALAVTTAVRSPVLPDLPTVGDAVPGYEVTGWYGLGAPKKTPGNIVEKLNAEVERGLAEPKLRERLFDLGGEPMPLSAPAFSKFVADETEKWGRLIKSAGIKPD